MEAHLARVSRNGYVLCAVKTAPSLRRRRGHQVRRAVARAALAAVVLLVSMGAKVRSPNFIVEHRDPQFAKQVAQAAEHFRQDLAVSWLGEPMPDWSAPCQLTVETGPRLGAGGATTFIFDRGEVYGWRMTIQGSRERVLDSVLPHEVTHTIFASHFRQPVPRWADEGGATSVEHSSERMKHRRMLVEFLRTGRGMPFNRMFSLKEYPRDIMPLYAQGYSVAEYLIQCGGRRKYIAFLDDAMERSDWSGAIQRHYGVDGTGILQQRWLAWVRQGSPPIRRQPTAPHESPQPEMLAGRTGHRSPAAVSSVYERVSHEEPLREGADSRPDPSPPNPDQGKVAASTRTLPDSGWRPAGSASGDLPASGAKAPEAVASRPAPVVRGSQAARPQSPRPARQVILEWSKP